MSRFREGIKEFYTYVRGERQGVVWLLALNVLLIIIWLGKDMFFTGKTSEIKIQYIEKGPAEAGRSTYQDRAEIDVQLFQFDPNGLSKEDWMKLGLSEKQINGIHNYEKAGGSFKTKEDVRKMYTISEEKFAELEPFIKIETRSIQQRDGSVETPEKEKTIEEYRVKKEEILAPIELNSADTAQLKSLRGIGPVYAKNMLKYRALLGGYHSIAQLNEVYGLRDNPELVMSISEYLTIDTISIKKIELNEAAANDLAGHIYIDWNVAKAIVAYRNVHGPYKSISGLKNCALVDEALLTKIAPYLKVD